MMSKQMEPAVQTLLDRQAILDCLTRYCRTIDRLDRELLLSCYHPDAIDDHATFVGNREAFADWAFAMHREHQHATFHHITNHSCEIDGDHAHTETYFIFASMNKNDTPLTVCGGRYVDHLEKREGSWAILGRRSMLGWQGVPGEVFFQREKILPRDANRSEPTRGKRDPSYERPLRVEAGPPAHRFIGLRQQTLTGQAGLLRRLAIV